MKTFRFHLALALAYGLLAVIHTYPLMFHLDSRLPGEGLADNVSFVWNTWWMREALSSSSQTFFECPFVLAPVGGSLVLHTHTALGAFAGATVLGTLSVVEAQNIVVIASLGLNGIAAYLLALAVTQARWPSAAAGALFLLAPAVSGRLMGHYNLVQAWPLALACLAFVQWWRVANPWTTAALAFCAALIPYVDYYYAIFFLLFAASYMATEVWSLDVRVQARPRSRTALWLGAMAAAAFAMAAFIAVSPVAEARIGPVRVSLRTPTNALTLGWLMAAAALLSRWRLHARVAWKAGAGPRQIATRLVWPVLIGILLMTPLVTAAWDLWRSGGYLTQESSLRSSPRGVDLATILLGPPHSGVFRSLVSGVYRRIGIDPIESSAWLGAVTLVLLLVGVRRHLAVRAFRQWLAIGAIFLVWALGPHLTLLSSNTGLLLPQAAARLVPVLNNARIPGRAMTMVALSAAVLVSIVLTRSWRGGRRSAGMAVLVAALALIELVAAPLPLVGLPAQGVYAALDADGGAVLTLPFGLRDGFGESGAFEHDALLGQTIHGHPLVGGFLARVPRKAWEWYENNEPFATLLTLSVGARPATLPSCETVFAGLRAAGVSWVVLYENDAPAALVSFAESRMPMERRTADRRRTLYRVGQSAAADRCRDSEPALVK